MIPKHDFEFISVLGVWLEFLPHIFFFETRSKKSVEVHRDINLYPLPHTDRDQHNHNIAVYCEIIVKHDEI
jgi:hypothetical protein